MKAASPEDLEFLHNIRGRFPSSKSQRQGEWLLILLFGVFFPLFSLFVFFAWWPVILDQDHLIVLAFAFGTFIGGIYIWRMRAVEYEFTGDEIIERRAGHIKNRICINNIVKIRIFFAGPCQTIIKTNNSEIKVQRIASLNETILKQAIEMNAKRSDAERRQMEAEAQKSVSRFKRAHLLGLVVCILVLFALTFLAVWLRQKF
jgi:hypothetical protein